MKKSLLFYSLFLSSVGFFGCTSASRFTTLDENRNDEVTTTKSFEKSTSLNLSVNEFQPLSHLDTTSMENKLDDYDDENLPDDEKIDFSTAFAKDDNSDSFNSASRDKMLASIIEYLDTPYLFGGNTKRGIDCSAFTQTIFRNSFSYSLLRSAREQFTQGEVVNNVDDLQFGDLVFFNTRRVKPGHVGIYVGNRHFVHASSRNGVIVSSIDHSYYSAKFMGGRRISTLALK